MKTIYLFILLYTTSAVNLYAQSIQNNSIYFNQITINTFSMDQTENSLKAILGNPDSIENFFNEIDDVTWIQYKYSVNSFYFFNNDLVSFDLKNASFYFYNPSIKVGNNISNINTIFPNSYQKRSVPFSSGLGFIKISLLMPDGTISDSSSITINYNPSTNIITSIHFYSN